jgi:hypothetical protein
VDRNTEEMDEKRPRECFADLDTVFPMGKDGLRETPAACLECDRKTECLRQAMTGKSGAIVREEILDRAYASGIMGFFERWAKKKTLARRKKQG